MPFFRASLRQEVNVASRGRAGRRLRIGPDSCLWLLAAPAAFIAAPSGAQISTPATPHVGQPVSRAPVGPPAPLPNKADLPLLIPRSGDLPPTLTLQQALEEAEARSPAIQAARAAVEAAQGRVRQAGFRANPEVGVEVENFLGTGALSGFRMTETTVSVNQRLDLAGRRRVRVTAAQAELAAEMLRLGIARADLFQQVRQQFAQALTSGERLRLAEANEARARELARLAEELVRAGREPPLRSLRARAAAAQAVADVASVRAAESSARSSLAALFGVTTPPEGLAGALLDLQPRTVNPTESLEVRLAEAERATAQAELQQQLVARRLDPAIGVGLRHVRETGDVALVAGVSMPLPIFDHNQGNIEAARANVRAADARRNSALAASVSRARSALANVESAEARVTALEHGAVPEAAEALRLAELAYRSGKASLLELLDAQNAYAAAQASLIDARLAQALATAELGRVAAQ